MLPGMRGMNPRQVQAAMKKMGIKQEEMEGVEEVIIRTTDTEFVIKDPSVTRISMQGQDTFQVVGTVTEESKKEGGIPMEDIKLVAQQANVSEAEAKKALEDCGGEPAEAIIKLMSG